MTMETSTKRDHSKGEDSASELDPLLHSSWRVALYYTYVDLSEDNVLEEQLSLHEDLCQRLQLKGRVRISEEGLNGVLTGIVVNLKEYEADVTRALRNITRTEGSPNDPHPPLAMDVKYCFLREDLSIESQLFPNLMVKQTKDVISLFDESLLSKKPEALEGASNSNRRRRRRPQSETSHQKVYEEECRRFRELKDEMMQVAAPSPHLTAEEWNRRLQEKSTSTAAPNKALLVDVRNVYESRVGYFAAPKVPTLLTNTRKYSDLPLILASNSELQKTEEIYLYCTGGVRCERVSMLVQSLYPEKQVYQLQGGIQTYLHETMTTTTTTNHNNNNRSQNLFRGKNFVFDPRRTDPVHFGETIGVCLACSAAHDDYDNGHAPSAKREARCTTCRVLILVCNTCRPKYQCWGEMTTSKNKDSRKPLLYCGLDRCVHEGAAPTPELVQTNA